MEKKKEEVNEKPRLGVVRFEKEADPKNGRISNESPFGRALLGGKEGEVKIAETPGGQVSLKIIKIE